MQILDFMQTMEKSGCAIKFDDREQIPEQGDFGTQYYIFDKTGKPYFSGIATAKVIGEWIKLHGPQRR